MSILILLLLGDSIDVTVTITIFHESKTNVAEPVPLENSRRLFASPALGFEIATDPSFLIDPNESYSPIPLMVQNFHCLYEWRLLYLREIANVQTFVLRIR